MLRRTYWFDVFLMVLAVVVSIAGIVMKTEFYDAAAVWTHP